MRMDLKKIAEDYRRKGYIWGYELLLYPQDALALLDILEQANILVVGCNLWRFWEKDRTYFVEIVGGCGKVEEELSRTDVEHNVRVLRAFLQQPLPYGAELISFDFAESKWWDWLVPPEEQYPHGKRVYPRPKDAAPENSEEHNS